MLQMNNDPQETATIPEQTERFFTPPLIIIFITVFIDLVGFGMVIPILPFYAESDLFNATPFEIGMLFSIYSWMQFFFAPILGRLSDRHGRRPILFISLLGSAIGYFVVGYASTLTMVFAGRIISGITGGNISTAQAYIADVTSKKNRAKGMGLFGAAFGLGFILGPGIAGVLSKYGVSVPFYVAAALSLMNALAVYFVLPESVKHVVAVSSRGLLAEVLHSIRAILDSLREPQFGLLNLVYFLLIVAFSMMTYAYVLYAAFSFGYDAEHVGYLFLYVGVISFIGQGLIFDRSAKRFGEAVLAPAGCLMMAASLATLPLITAEVGGLTVLLVASAFLAFGNAMASPALMSLASKMSHESEQGKALGIMQSGASLARAIGPSIGGVLLNNSANRIDSFTILRTFWTASAIMCVTFLVAVYFARFMREQVVA